MRVWPITFSFRPPVTPMNFWIRITPLFSYAEKCGEVVQRFGNFYFIFYTLGAKSTRFKHLVPTYRRENHLLKFLGKVRSMCWAAPSQIALVTKLPFVHLLMCSISFTPSQKLHLTPPIRISHYYQKWGGFCIVD